MKLLRNTKTYIATVCIFIVLAATPVTNTTSNVSSPPSPPSVVQPSQTVHVVNWNVIIPLVTFILSLAAAYAKTKSEKAPINENSLRTNIVTLDINKHIEQVSKTIEDAIKEQIRYKELQAEEHARFKDYQAGINQELKASIVELQREIAIAKQKAIYDDRSIEQLKIENKEIMKKLEKVVSDLIIYLNQ